MIDSEICSDEHLADLLAYEEMMTAVYEGRAIELGGCYVCAPAPSEDQSTWPLRGMKEYRVIDGADPTQTYLMIPCGHVVI